MEEHIQHVRQVLQRFLENKVFVKAEKCEFHVDSVGFLGYIIESGKVKMNPRKIQAVAEWPIPTSRKELQQFLGIVNFCRRLKPCGLIPDRIILSTTPFSWTPEVDAAFSELKRF